MGSKIVRMYQDFWAHFCRIVHGNTVLPSHNAQLTFKQIGSKLSLSTPIALISWPCEKDPSGTVDIIVYYEMTVDQITTRIQRVASSKACVFYFHGGVASSPSAQILRFEYEPTRGMNDGDPLFHAQLGGKKIIIREDLPEPLQSRWPYSDQPKSAITSYVHIPTPRMLLPDLLCLIVADYLRDRVHDLVKDARAPLSDLTGMVCDELYAGLEFWNQIPVSNWYRRAPIPPATIHVRR
jgi:hypothetical protein